MMDDDDFLDDSDLDSHLTAPIGNGPLIAPAPFYNEAVRAVVLEHFKDPENPAAGAGGLIMFCDFVSDGSDELIVSNIDDFRAKGYAGSADPAELEEWLRSLPSDQEFIDAVMRARGE